jgi:hypothetical protein
MKLILIRLLKELNNIKLYIPLNIPTLNNDLETKKIRDQCGKGMCGEHYCVDTEREENERGISLCKQSYLVQMIYIYIYSSLL